MKASPLPKLWLVLSSPTPSGHPGPPDSHLHLPPFIIHTHSTQACRANYPQLYSNNAELGMYQPLPWNNPWTVQTHETPKPVTIYEMETHRWLGSNRGHHYYQFDANLDGLEFTINELDCLSNANLTTQKPLLKKQPIHHLFMRNAVAWFAPDYPYITLNSFFMDNIPAELTTQISPSLCEAPFGLMLIDTPQHQSAHFLIQAQQQVRDDLSILYANQNEPLLVLF